MPIAAEMQRISNQLFQAGSPDELEPFEELTEDDSSDAGPFGEDVDVTQDEDDDGHRSKLTNAGNTDGSKGNSSRNDANAAAAQADSDSEFEFSPSAYDDSETSSEAGQPEQSSSMPHGGKSSAPFDRPLSKRDIWRALRSSLTADEMETFNNVLRREPSRDLDENEDAPAAGMTGRERERVKVEDGQEAQSWLSVIYDVPPLSSFSMGSYWNDKRFLRQRKMHREMSMASGTESLLNKADIVLALFRDIGIVRPKGREFSSPDSSLKRTLAQVDIPNMPTGGEENTSKDDSGAVEQIKQDALLVASRRLQSESEIVGASVVDQPNGETAIEAVDAASSLPAATSSQVRLQFIVPLRMFAYQFHTYSEFLRCSNL
ncbi:hypothetical protein ANCCEY_13040 [Ancylostoma ceylanicum]|uniref:Uncharacterized protein n=1 Tax=Ancylostoma ceylanicum TaxID=53326 RepID=A0A0D6L7Y9_9BILA|nr:hypothetical protein ANCCEY_13040 [Ancylostoma ceylanicum]